MAEMPRLRERRDLSCRCLGPRCSRLRCGERRCRGPRDSTGSDQWRMCWHHVPASQCFAALTIPLHRARQKFVSGPDYERGRRPSVVQSVLERRRPVPLRPGVRPEIASVVAGEERPRGRTTRRSRRRSDRFAEEYRGDAGIRGQARVRRRRTGADRIARPSQRIVMHPRRGGRAPLQPSLRGDASCGWNTRNLGEKVPLLIGRQ
ncbi:MAG: hypothetical protein V7647_1113 [Acidobacteriota bacterium]|jgi:hypothetical protein